MATRDSLIKKTIVVGAFGTLGVAALLLAIPWWLGWRGANYWSTAGALAATAGAVFTLGAAIAAVVYVRLTYRLWREAAAQREGDLMLRLIDEYDALRGDIESIRQYYVECATSGPTDPLQRFGDEMQVVDCVLDAGARDVDVHRYRVSRFFVRTRKLVEAGYLSRRVVVAALARSAIRDIFLKLVDPLDEAKARKKYNVADREFYTELLTQYRQED